jgi:hypothetical protein
MSRVPGGVGWIIGSSSLGRRSQAASFSAGPCEVGSGQPIQWEEEIAVAVVVIQEFESSREEYDQVSEKLDAENNPPDGLILHTAADLGGGKMKVVDVWESQDDFQEFVGERLTPAIAEVVGPDAPPADIQAHELFDLVKR